MIFSRHDAAGQPLRIHWEGSFFANHSLALVNREFASRLVHKPDLRVSIGSNEAETSFGWDEETVRSLRGLEADPGDVAITVRHRWPLNPHAPARGKWVIAQPWEYGSVPRAWLDPMCFGADEVWVPSTFNRLSYIESGIPEQNVRVVPLGVQDVMFTPPESFPLRTRKRFKFLFVGGTIQRKGIDLLIDAYTRTFTRDDDVCLVVKDFGAGSFYRFQTYDRFIQELQANPRMPEIEYISDELTPERMRDLYHACDALVHPFRGEGFGLPIAEAMACGLPVVVPDKGGASDFATASTAVVLASRRVMLPPQLAHGLETVGAPWWLEVSPEELRGRMRDLYERPEAYASLAAEGRSTIRERFTWNAAADAAHQSLLEIGERAEPFRSSAEAQYRARLARGVTCWERGMEMEAVRHFGVARACPGDVDAIFNLGAALATRGDHRTAAPVLDVLLSRLDGAEDADAELIASTAKLLAGCRLALGEPDAALLALGSAQVPADDAEAEELRAAAASGPQAALVAGTAPPRIRWLAPFFDGSGYADEARNFVLGLRDLGWQTSLTPLDAVRERGVITTSEFETLRGMVETGGRIDLHFQHAPADAAVPPLAPVSVLRTMFETDRLDPEWVDVCNQFTEVWVPTEFNRETFTRSGVVQEKIRVVAGSLDVALYDPSKHRPLSIPGAPGFRFLSVFDWQIRKGWDVLLRAYFEEFGPDENVSLVIKAGKHHTSTPPAEFIAEFAEKNGYRNTPRVEIVDRYFTTEEMISLYLACDAFVLPTRGEGWGRPYMEAMALGMPTIGTRWSGNLAFMNDENSYLVDVDGMEPSDLMGFKQFVGHLWARPSIASTRAQMRRVLLDRDEARARGARARLDIVERFSRETVAGQIDSELRRLLNTAWVRGESLQSDSDRSAA